MRTVAANAGDRKSDSAKISLPALGGTGGRLGPPVSGWRTVGSDPVSDEVVHASEADPEELGADEEHSSPLISTDQTEKETAFTEYCFDAYCFEAYCFGKYWVSLPHVWDQRELAEISVPKFFLPPNIADLICHRFAPHRPANFWLS